MATYYRKPKSTTVVDASGVEVAGPDIPQDVLSNFSSLEEYNPNANRIPRYEPTNKIGDYYTGLDRTAPTAGEETGIREQERKRVMDYNKKVFEIITKNI